MRFPLPDEIRHIPDTPAVDDPAELSPRQEMSPLPASASSPVRPVSGVSPGTPSHQDGFSLPAGSSHIPGTPMDGGPNNPRFHNDEPRSDDDVVAMDVEQRGGESLPTPTRYDLIMCQLGQALNDRESELSGRPQGERSIIQTFSLPASHQEATNSESPDDPVPDQFEVTDFLPDDDRLLAPPGKLAAVPDNDVLKFVLIQRKTGSFSTPWSIPSRGDSGWRLLESSTCLPLPIVPKSSIHLLCSGSSEIASLAPRKSTNSAN